jgi:class 3 adenylate cyclase/cytoskeletal protein RodZ
VIFLRFGSQRGLALIEQENRTFICSVVYCDIADYSTKPVEVQIRLKDQLNRFTSEAIKNVVANERIILDTGDGAAICFLGDPEDALFAAMNLRDAVVAAPDDPSGPLRVRFGINLGPVKVVNDINNRKNIIGDGINVGQRIMSFAEPGQILVSRSYYDVVSCLTQEYSQLFHYIGTRSDKHVRKHEVYSILSPADQEKSVLEKAQMAADGAASTDAGDDSSVRVSASDSSLDNKETPRREPRSTQGTSFRRPHRKQTSGFVYGGGVAVLIGVILLALFLWNSGKKQASPDRLAPPLPTPAVSPISTPPVVSPPAEKTVLPTPTPLPTVIPTMTPTPIPTPAVPETTPTPESAIPSPVPLPVSETVVPEKTETEMPIPSPPVSNTVQQPEPTADPRPESSQVPEPLRDGQKTEPDTPVAVSEATLLFAVTPWGEVSVDGKHLGASPPLISLPIAPGKHTIEITNTAFPPFTQTIDIAPNEKLKISHKFK